MPRRLTAGPATAAAPAMDASSLGAFLDDFFAREMAAHNVPGAAVSVVKDGQVLLTRGYGYADVEAGRPVDPAGGQRLGPHPRNSGDTCRRPLLLVPPLLEHGVNDTGQSRRMVGLP